MEISAGLQALPIICDTDSFACIHVQNCSMQKNLEIYIYTCPQTLQSLCKQPYVLECIVDTSQVLLVQIIKIKTAQMCLI